MPAHPVDSIRTIAFVGHTGAGKTSLVEALLYAGGALKTPGTVERGTTVCDFDPMERELAHSVKCAIAHLPFRGLQLSLVDTPGLADLAGHSIPALSAVDTVVVVVNATRGIERGADRMMKLAAEAGLGRMVVVNRIDAPGVDLAARIAEIRERWGRQCLLLDLPAHDGKDIVEVIDHDSGDADVGSVAEAHRQLVDQLVEEDEDLLARFLEEGTDPTATQLHAPFEKALREGHLVPVVFTSAKTGVGVPELLHIFETLAPNPTEGNPRAFERVEGELATPFTVRPDADAHVLAHVWRTWYDPYLGKIAAFRVHQGTMRKDQSLFVGDAAKPMRAAHLYRVRGSQLEEVDALGPGEIGALAKVEEIDRDHILHDHPEDAHLRVVPVPLPRPMYGLAVDVKKRTDEQRMFEVLHKVQVEDACVSIERHPTLHETVIYGLGEQHLRVILKKLSTRYNLELDARPPRVPYRETITKAAEGHCRHKKQTGGAGQFGEVFLRVEPLPAGGGFEFVDEVRGGVIPGVFLPAIEKGVRKALSEGVAAGYPVHDVRVSVYDGKTHAVDGKEIAFVTAGRKATLEALAAAAPVVLEPIVTVSITVGDAWVGALTSELAGRNGHINRVDTLSPEESVIQAQVPLAELGDFGSRLKSITGGGGSYELAPSHHARVAPAVQERLAKVWERPEEVD